MYHSAHEWSVFCALDSIVAARPGELGDLSFVSHVRDKRKSRLGQLPFVGPGWYHRVAVEFLLHFGVIDWACISHSFSSTGRLPADAFQKPLQQMEEAWEGGGKNLFAKLSINMMVGLWACDSKDSFKVKSSRDAVDGVGHTITQTFSHGKDAHISDFIYRTTSLTNASMRPIHDQIMHTEATRVAQLLWIIKSLGVPERAVSDVKTDCILLAGLAK